MKTISEKTNPKGNRVVTVELAPGEVLMAFNPDGYYKLGEPVDDIIAGHHITNSRRASWASDIQEWLT